MTNGMVFMIMAALTIYVVTGLVSIGIVVWFIKVFGPIYKQMVKQMNKMYSELEKQGE